MFHTVNYETPVFVFARSFGDEAIQVFSGSPLRLDCHGLKPSQRQDHKDKFRNTQSHID